MIQDRVVLITGGSSGIGLATAQLFASRGARVWICSRSTERLDRALATLPPSARAVAVDVSDGDSVRNLVQTLQDQEGRLDVLINSAGQLELSPAEDGVAAAERLIETNYLGVARMVAGTLPLLRKSENASIVILSSFVGRLVPPFWSAYAASKFALQAYSYSLRQELAEAGIHVGLVLPGPVESPMTEDHLRTSMYPVPWGIPVISPDRVSKAILESVERRTSEQSVPKRFLPMLRLASAFPRLVDFFYARYR